MLAFTTFRWLRPPASALLLCLAVLLPQAAQGQAVCPEPVARLVAAEGPVDLERASLVRPVALDDVLCPGDVVRVGPRGRATVALADGGVLRLDQNTVCRVGEGAARRTLLDLFFGALHFLSRRTQALEVATPFVNAAVEGTEFALRVLPDRTRLDVYEGRVRLANPLGQLLVASGEGAEAAADEAPVLRVVVRPRDAVQWALHYPPVLTPPAVPPPELTGAVEAATRGDLRAAFARLDEVPEAARDAGYHRLRAGLLLAVGRADDARADVERALALQPEAAEALALRAVIELVMDDKARALADARRAVAAGPDSAAAALALSYALQARFELEEAREVLRAAVARDPGEPLLRARLAELELAFGEVGRARLQAEAAAALAPELGRAQAVLGFVALAAIDLDAAEEAFARAFALQPEDPLAHLGQGLALIRRSELEAGRQAIEVAAGLDPGNALIRSYLGKAYFEERDDATAAEAFATAKALDPLDPTSFFYDAIRKQLANRPVEALDDLETAIALNDNRAVYRSRLLLDQDLAVRGVSLARIYDDLGFDRAALAEATKSLSLDPANWSAHRFLSDAYASLPRHEIARVSELLRAQLLQPININPVQPSAPITDLNIVRGLGPAEGAFNEFHPLFERNRLQLTASGLVGNHDTFGNELVLSGIWDNVSVSAGQFHYQTDGFRPNNDRETNLYNVFAQAALTPALSVQAEFRRRDTEQGDLSLNFDPDDFSRTDRRDIEQNVFRLGGRWTPTPRSSVILSGIYSNRDESVSQEFPELTVDAFDDESGYQIEAQYIHRAGPLNVVAGAGTYDIDVEERFIVEFAPPLPCLLPSCDVTREFESEQRTVYVYGDLNLPPGLIWTAGLSYDDFAEGPVESNRFNPKFGLRWLVTPNLQLRLAAFQTVKRRLMVDQTIEPTQVAGFNQFFDDINGTKARRYGVGLDARLASRLYGGLEVSRRDLDVSIGDLDTGSVRVEDRREDLYRAYLHWAPHRQWALTAEILFDRFDREQGPNIQDPTEVDTLSIPLAVRYFSPLGFFAELGATYVRQRVERPDESTLADGTETFPLLDAAVGFRFPNRRGIVSLEGHNLLDKEFRFQDDNFRLSEPRAPSIVPARTVFGRLTLTF